MGVGMAGGTIQSYLPYDAPSIMTGIPTIDYFNISTNFVLFQNDLK